MKGSLRLRAAVAADGRTVLRECIGSYPLQVTRPQCEPGGRVSLIVLLQSGGLLDGDELTVDVHVEAGARLALRTQAATQIHAGRSVQTLHARIDASGALSYVPHALVPHAAADFTSSTVLDLADGARVLCAETLSPGRLAFGEQFAYARVRLRLDAWRGEVCLARERALVEPCEATRSAQFGEWTHVATAYALGRDEWRPRAVSGLESSELARGGWVVRGLGRRAADLDRAIAALASDWWSAGCCASDAEAAGGDAIEAAGRLH